MQDAIHRVAKEYGWSKSQLLDEVYPEELPMLLKRIEQDQRLELASRIDDLLMQLRIAVAPHLKNPGPEIARISRELIARRREILGNTKPAAARDERVVRFFERQLAALKGAPADDHSETTAVPNRGNE